MYVYDQYDQKIVQERANQFREQTERRIRGDLEENKFKPLRLQNGLYMQLHAYMLRVAIPYGLLSSRQMRMLAHIAKKYDRGYGHFSTRQNIQYNWPQLPDVPSILDDLASVEMHAVQTSGNCIRNTTSDPFAGVAPDEIEDPRPYCELIRQWSTFHPEFAYLPRKFKIAVTGATSDRAAVRIHDIGVRIVKNDAGETGFEVLAGGGLGRTPRIAAVIGAFVKKPDLLGYLESILRVYNRFGRRDNKYKARIKILVGSLGVEKFRALVEEEFAQIRDTTIKVTDAELERLRGHFVPPEYETGLTAGKTQIEAMKLGKDREFATWIRNNVFDHKVPGYAIAKVTLKTRGKPPGDVTDSQMESLADMADRFSFGEIRATHDQNLVLADVKIDDLAALHAGLVEIGLAEPNSGLLTDMISCPGLDFCNLANARSIPIAQRISERFDNYDYLHDLGDISVKISGCINACGHHHVGNIGILGIDLRGEEHYQLSLGGSPEDDASIGKIVGPAFSSAQIVPAIQQVLDTYVERRNGIEESFLDCVRRLGVAEFRAVLYPS